MLAPPKAVMISGLGELLWTDVFKMYFIPMKSMLSIQAASALWDDTANSKPSNAMEKYTYMVTGNNNVIYSWKYIHTLVFQYSFEGNLYEIETFLCTLCCSKIEPSRGRDFRFSDLGVWGTGDMVDRAGIGSAMWRKDEHTSLHSFELTPRCIRYPRPLNLESEISAAGGHQFCCNLEYM